MSSILFTYNNESVTIVAYDNTKKTSTTLVNGVLNTLVHTRVSDGAGGFSNKCDYSFTVQANDGYLLNVVRYSDGAGGFNGFTISEDKKTATRNNVTASSKDVTISLQIEGESEQPPIMVAGFNHLYKVDKSHLTQLGDVTFFNSEDVASKFIINVLEIPFGVPSEFIGLEAPIKLGKSIMLINAPLILNDELLLSLGSIHVPMKYNNVFDYANTKTMLHLPFTQSIELDIEYVIGETITIEYVLNLYDGDVSVLVRSSKVNNAIINNDRFRIGKNIPFVQNIGVVTNELTVNPVVLNGIYSPYIEVIRNNPHESEFNTQSIKDVQLIHEKGMVKVVDIVLNSSCNLVEKTNIINLLKGGVLIK